MDYIKKVGYLKGLAAGLELDASTPERKVLLAIVDALEEMTETIRELGDTVDDLESECEHMADELDTLTEDMEEIEEGVSEFARIFGDVLETDGKEPIKLFGDDDDDDDEDEDEDDGEYSYAVTCPLCKKEFVLTEDDLTKEGAECPFCKEKLEFEVHLCDDDECGCGHDHHDHHKRHDNKDD